MKKILTEVVESKQNESDTDLFGNTIEKDELLRDRFIEPPFSVLDTKSGDWQKRKRMWKKIGIKSEVSRENVTVIRSFDTEKYGRKEMPEVSIFDPALCELMYNWYCPKGGSILDPFAGGSVRGIVANYLGFNYTGIDIRREQIDSNREQALDLLPIDRQPNYYVGDSNIEVEGLIPTYDMIFSCPPYSDLEVYSDLEGDISNKPYEDFIEIYNSIIKKTCSKLKKGGYAVFVVGDIRDKKTGFYKDFVSHTKQAFIKSGVFLYNEAILLQPLGTAMLRAAKIFQSGKKLTKVHENVLIFKKP